MPKRSNDFQRLVALIEKSINGPGVKVTESKEIFDRIIDIPREIDIYI